MSERQTQEELKSEAREDGTEVISRRDPSGRYLVNPWPPAIAVDVRSRGIAGVGRSPEGRYLRLVQLATMGLLALQRLLSLQRDRQRRQRQARASILNGSIAASSVGKRKGSCSEQDAHGSKAVKKTRHSIPALPEDIWCHIHSLLPLCDAARAACLSHSFLRSWRCYPNITLNRHILGSNANVPRENSSCIIDNILRKHSGSHIKILKLQLYGIYDSCQYLDSWLQVAVTPGIEELTIAPYHSTVKMKQNVPCEVLADGVRNSLRRLHLSFCAFHPTADLGLLRNLTSLCLESVHILDDEFECFLSNSPALERLDIKNCLEIMCMRIPSVLLQLHYLKVSSCLNLRVLESKARNLSSFSLNSGCNVKVSLGETMQMKNFHMRRSNLICYARAEFPSNLPNLESLYISSNSEMVDTPILPSKYLFLKHIYMGWAFRSVYDYFSLVSFLDASPCLENLLLNLQVSQHASVFDGSSQLRDMPEQHHGCLKSVKFIGFNSEKSLVELTCYILKNAKSLGCLTLDTTYGDPKCDDTKMTAGRCASMNRDFLIEARRGVAAIRMYIEDKVPATVKLTVVEHCTRCHADTLSA